ncbi:hypothetical protein F5879DRAFT_893112 [Lentinula edodes]|uniref:uncharacterized protein n=1 Tax=Lentinula edodes TaxID=5353 RepID=UPI001E8E49DE|nr:uncharacterized protein C8R40DRAFT_1046878 [Lentinula edodes]KAH7874696.1 hypothetical protein C8R40DRAFT_1046878 [Lentinula edodes]KAJ3909195.1 hypothetical protein F5879DRAFT_893112 [Lentinula edodes]
MPTATHPSHVDGYAHYDHLFPSNTHYIHLFPSNPYQTLNPPPPPAVPQSVAHKVWIIDCRSCGTFLTNRGMKAVLLLRPNVPLYSSDALPANCSAYTTNPEALEPPISCRPPTQPSRTCECLTQTLCCQGCGSTIGYMIVIPCIRCTSSISANNRATNGHRFVFHSSEVVGTERHYVPNEPGVMPFETVPVAIHPLLHMHYPAHSREVSPPHTHISPNEYLPTPPLDTMDLSPVSSLSSPAANNSWLDHQNLPSGLRISEHHLLSSASSSPPSNYDGSPGRGSDRTGLDTSPPSLLSANSSFSFGMPAEQAGQTLKGGDSLFWHHLIRYGEIPGVSNDPRARKANPEDLPRKSAMFGR